jgi:hypothetical protein
MEDAVRKQYEPNCLFGVIVQPPQQFIGILCLQAFSVSIPYAVQAYIHAAVHTSDRVTTGVEMSIPLSIGEAQETRSLDTGLQFLVGQDETGHWIAVESRGRGGGIFVNRQAALNYAAFETGRRSDAVQCSTEPLALWRRFDANVSNRFGGRR